MPQFPLQDDFLDHLYSIADALGDAGMQAVERYFIERYDVHLRLQLGRSVERIVAHVNSTFGEIAYSIGGEGGKTLICQMKAGKTSVPKLFLLYDLYGDGRRFPPKSGRIPPAIQDTVKFVKETVEKAKRADGSQIPESLPHFDFTQEIWEITRRTSIARFTKICKLRDAEQQRRNLHELFVEVLSGIRPAVKQPQVRNADDAAMAVYQYAPYYITVMGQLTYKDKYGAENE